MCYSQNGNDSNFGLHSRDKDVNDGRYTTFCGDKISYSTAFISRMAHDGEIYVFRCHTFRARCKDGSRDEIWPFIIRSLNLDNKVKCIINVQL